MFQNILFEQCWKDLNQDSKYENLRGFCGNIATVFPSQAAIESDFSVINFEKNDRRFHMTDLTLEGILQSKQLDALLNLSH